MKRLAIQGFILMLILGMSSMAMAISDGTYDFYGTFYFDPHDADGSATCAVTQFGGTCPLSSNFCITNLTVITNGGIQTITGPAGAPYGINIGSVTSVFGYSGIVPYCASRGGVMHLTKALADEWGQFGINVNVLAPGWFKTAQTQVLYENTEWVEYICDRIPLKRPGKPNDLDGTVVFLASDASEYITGQVILVDGGISTGATRATIEKK